MRVPKVAKVVGTVPTKRRTKQPMAKPIATQPITTQPITPQTRFTYQSDIDPAVIIHSNKTHRTASEAFRDADYATALWRCENDWDRFKEYLRGITMIAMLFGSLYLFAVWFESAVK